jgi:hypothetical protein
VSQRKTSGRFGNTASGEPVNKSTPNACRHESARCWSPMHLQVINAPSSLRCDWFGHAWEFRVDCCWLTAQCRRCRKVGHTWMRRMDCEKVRRAQKECCKCGASVRGHDEA